jgi:hypothetical protein
MLIDMIGKPHGVLLAAALLLISLLGWSGGHSLGGTLCLNACSGHGKCRHNSTSGATCSCDVGWGASSDITSYRAPDCSSRTCPSNKAWAWVATSNVSAHDVRECSNQGLCDHRTGLCRCSPGFFGAACERRGCPNDCSGHGRCVSMKILASRPDAMPLSAPAKYQEVLTLGSVALNTPWDDEKIFGCLCDSEWPVGLGSGQRQASEWFGPDCSQRHCPSGDDPVTVDADETNCYNKTAAGGQGVGLAGNLCHVDCSNRGVCNYADGTCSCFPRFYGLSCSLTEASYQITAESVSFH